MFSRIAATKYVEIGNNVLTGPNVFIADFNHEYRNPDLPISVQGNFSRPVKIRGEGVFIGDDSWIGTHVVISGNIHIGKHCVIGANSVVTHDIPDYCVAVGSPCKIIKKYDFDLKKWTSVQ